MKLVNLVNLVILVITGDSGESGRSCESVNCGESCAYDESGKYVESGDSGIWRFL